MRVLHLMKCAAHLAIATCYGLIFQGVHDPWVYAVLCDSYYLLFMIEAGEIKH
jgi:hypothetical protein